MALTYVGGNTGTWAGATSGNNTVSLTALTGGSSASAAAGDLVIAVYATGSAADRALTITDGTTAYTLIATELYANGTTYDTNLRVAYKLLTGADASVTFGPTGNAQDAGAAAVHVWRGSNTNGATPFDVTATSATGTGTGRPNGAAIAPVTAGTVVVVAGGAAAATGALFTQPGTELSNFRTATSVDTNDAMVGIGSFAWTSGTFDPVAWTGGTANAADSWASVTIAIRVKDFPLTSNAGSYTYTGQSATVLRNKQLSPSAGSYTYTGKSADIVKGAALQHYTLTANAGSYSYSGQSATLLKDKLITASAGSYTYTGQSSTIAHDRKLTADAGSYTYTGQSATIDYNPTAVNYALTCSAGSYSMTGQSASVLVGKVLSGSAGTYSFAGQDATIAKDRNLSAESGAYSLSGQSALIDKTVSGGYELTALSGAYEYGEYYVSNGYVNGGYYGNVSIEITPATVITPSYGSLFWLMPPPKKKSETEEEKIEDAVEEVISMVGVQELPPDPKAVLEELKQACIRENIEFKKKYEPMLYEKVRKQLQGLVNEVSQMNRKQVLAALQEQEDEERAVLELLMEM